MERTDIEGATVATQPTALEGGLSRLNWRSIFGGTFAALGFWILLGAFGVAIGLTALNPEEPNLKGVGIWLGVWSLLVPILAMFAGTMVATRASGAVRRTTGMLYGLVVWGFTAFIGTVFTVMLISSVVGRSVTAATQLLGGAGSAVAQMAREDGASNTGQAVAGFLNVDRQDILQAINQRLQEQGVPPVQEQQLQAALQDMTNSALREGRLTQETVLAALTRHTDLSREDAQHVAGQLRQQWDESVVGPAVTTALRTLEMAGRTLWWVFGSLLIGLGAALGAGLLATSGRMKHLPEVAPARRLQEAPAPT